MVLAVQLQPGLVPWALQQKKSVSAKSKIGNGENAPNAVDYDAPNSNPPATDQSKTETASKAVSANDPNASLVKASTIFGSESADSSRNDDEGLIPSPFRTESLPADSVETDEKRPSSVSVPAIQIVNGKSYSSLEAACAEASEIGSVTIIELRYNGLREPERPIRLINKKIVIRAVDGYRPIIRFSVADTYSDSTSPHMITVAGGSLDLEKVDLVMNVPNRFKGDRWALFSLERAEKVQLNLVNLTLDNPHNNPACAFEQRASAGRGLEGMGIKNDGMPVVPPELLLTNSLVRGNGDFIVMQDPVAARFDLKDVAIGLDGNLLQVKLVTESLGAERESISLELDHVTFRFGQSLISVEGTGGATEKLPKIFVFARNNILSCGRDQTTARDQLSNRNQAMISMRGLAEFMDFQKSFSWRGNLNFYDRLETFVELSLTQPYGIRQLEYADWKSLTNEGVGSSNQNQAVVWKSKWSEKSYANLTDVNFALAAESQPAGKGASDGNAAGVTLEKLPPAPRSVD